jgi:two-component system chemotaxis response regulator CheB
MASSLTYEGGETTVEALSLSAAGCIAKPVAKSASESVNQLLKELVPQVKAIVRPPKLRLIPSSRSSSPPSQKLIQPAAAPKIIVIGSSTGGPQALREVLSGLPTDFPLPILIVQHMPPMFTPMLAKHLAKDTGRPCQEASEGVYIQTNNTYVAPGDYHMVVDKKNDHMVLTLNQNEQEHYCRPSVNPMFHSAADWYGKSVVGVMLTGMGSDGIEGTHTLVEKQSFMIAQGEESSVVWGMPAAVVNNDLAHRVLPLDQIASQILRLCTQEACLS